MKINSINIHNLNLRQKIILVAGLIFLIISIIVFLFAFSYKMCNIDNGEFGDLISGTIGVGVGFFTMLMVIITLEEQRKMNRQIELHHLIESFDHTFDRFTNITHLFSKSRTSDTINIRQDLESIWKGPDGIEVIFARFATKLISATTQDDIDKIAETCRNEDLIMVARTMNRLSDLRRAIGNIDTKAVSRINDDWKTIPFSLKIYSSFFYVWHSEFSDDEYEREGNELIPLYKKINNYIFPTSIPKFKITIDESEISLNEREFAKKFVKITSTSPYPLNLTKICIQCDTFVVTEFENILNIQVEPNSEITISFGQLFGNQLQSLFHELTRREADEFYQFYLHQDITIDYKRIEWIYQNIIEFYSNNLDRKASIIFI